MNVKQNLTTILTEILNEYPHVFLVEMTEHHGDYEVILDGDEGLGIYDISKISRSLNHFADEQMPEEAYSLDVCTPGADSPLKMLRQYAKHIGREFEITNLEGTKYKASLVSINENELTFDYFISEKPKKNEQKTILNINFDQIKTAKIILSFK